MKVWIAMDNGKGTTGIINENGEVELFCLTPTVFGQDYTKAKKNITRINVPALYNLLQPYAPGDGLSVKALVERCMINPARFAQSISSARMMEAQITVLESLKIPYQFIDSKEWQKELLPKGIKGSEELKKASLDIGKRLFPNHVLKHPDMDGILIAEYGRRKNL